MAEVLVRKKVTTLMAKMKRGEQLTQPAAYVYRTARMPQLGGFVAQGEIARWRLG